MSQHGAALQTYNQELVKCELERGIPITFKLIIYIII